MMKAFEFFHIPPGVLFVLSLTYRYINVLLTAALDMMLARKSRTVGRQSAGAARSGVGIIAGNLMVKSITLSGEVRDAMVSRGYTGKIRTVNNFIFHSRDVLVGLSLIGIIGIGFLSA
jgi:cobalt/nickel transport system permease protein